MSSGFAGKNVASGPVLLLLCISAPQVSARAGAGVTAQISAGVAQANGESRPWFPAPGWPPAAVRQLGGVGAALAAAGAAGGPAQGPAAAAAAGPPAAAAALLAGGATAAGAAAAAGARQQPRRQVAWERAAGEGSAAAAATTSVPTVWANPLTALPSAAPPGLWPAAMSSSRHVWPHSRGVQSRRRDAAGAARPCCPATAIARRPAPQKGGGRSGGGHGIWWGGKLVPAGMAADDDAGTSEEITPQLEAILSWQLTRAEALLHSICRLDACAATCIAVAPSACGFMDLGTLCRRQQSLAAHMAAQVSPAVSRHMASCIHVFGGMTVQGINVMSLLSICCCQYPGATHSS